MNSIRITSSLGAEYRDDLERLLFFNPGQERVRARIAQAVEQYGAPTIHERDNKLRIGVEALGECQTLYAIDNDGSSEVLAGMIVFFRVPENTLLLLHIAIAKDYAAGGSRAEQLSLRFVRAVESIASRLRGVEGVTFQYASRISPSRAEAASTGAGRSLDERIASRAARKKA